MAAAEAYLRQRGPSSTSWAGREVSLCLTRAATQAGWRWRLNLARVGYAGKLQGCDQAVLATDGLNRWGELGLSRGGLGLTGAGLDLRICRLGLNARGLWLDGG